MYIGIVDKDGALQTCFTFDAITLISVNKTGSITCYVNTASVRSCCTELTVYYEVKVADIFV